MNIIKFFKMGKRKRRSDNTSSSSDDEDSRIRRKIRKLKRKLNKLNDRNVNDDIDNYLSASERDKEDDAFSSNTRAASLEPSEGTPSIINPDNSYNNCCKCLKLIIDFLKSQATVVLPGSL